MDVAYIQENSQTKTTVFNKSPKMSTYLVVFVISNFNSTQSSKNPSKQNVLFYFDLLQ